MSDKNQPTTSISILGKRDASRELTREDFEAKELGFPTLPPEILNHVQSFLKIDDLRNLAQVSRGMHAIVTEYPYLITAREVFVTLIRQRDEIRALDEPELDRRNIVNYSLTHHCWNALTKNQSLIQEMFYVTQTPEEQEKYPMYDNKGSSFFIGVLMALKTTYFEALYAIILLYEIAFPHEEEEKKVIVITDEEVRLIKAMSEKLEEYSFKSFWSFTRYPSHQSRELPTITQAEWNQPESDKMTAKKLKEALRKIVTDYEDKHRD